MDSQFSTDFPATLPRLGVLGGMGPMATIDFLRKLVLATPAQRDQDHIPLVVRFCAEVPDRTEALTGRGASPRDALIAAARELAAAGARALAMPCNTAHVWHDAIAEALPSLPFLHIVDGVVDELAAHQSPGPIGLLATSGTLRAQIYQSRARNLSWLEPTTDELERLVMPGIRAVKASRQTEAHALLNEAARTLVARGARAVVMGCTEVPLALEPLAQSERQIGVPLIDSNAALARGCVAWAQAAARNTATACA